MINDKQLNLLELTTTVVSTYIENNAISPANLPGFIKSVYDQFSVLVEPSQAPPEPAPVPAVNPIKSVHEDYIICLEDGKKFKSLKRHLGAHHNLSPEQYRAKWGLPHDYPMIAPSYAAVRSGLAKKIGFGRNPHKRRNRSKNNADPI